jgi:PAS domain S-box-containing protein
MKVTLDGAWEDLFWTVFQRSTNPIAVLDEQERIVAVNDAGATMIGTRRFQLLGSPMSAVFSPQTRPEAQRNWQQILRSGEYAGKQRLQQTDGHEIEVEYASRLIQVQARAVVVVVVLPVESLPFYTPQGSEERASLSKREREVVGLIALGLETPEIAKRLHISEHTVRAHVRNAMKRTGARTRAHLVAIVLSDRLLEASGLEGAPAPA